MNKERLLILASESKLLKGLAANLCNHRDIQHDLFQEFLLYLCEKPEDFLLNKYESAQFISYCSNCVKGLNSHRLRNAKLVNSKCPLVERHNAVEIVDFDIEENIYNFDVEEKINEIVNFAKEDKFKVEVLFKSVVTSTRQIAQDLGVNQRKLIYQNNLFKKELRTKLR